MDTQLDPSIIALTKAIGHQESGGDYNKIGDNGHSKGAYQWNSKKPLSSPDEIPENFRSYAAEVGADGNDFSPANQDRVAYKTVEKWGKQGLTPAQIASKWNSGKPDEYKTAKPGYNAAQGIKYDVKAYVDHVSRYYDEFSKQNQGQQSQSDPALQREPSLKPDETLRNEVYRRRNEIKNIKDSDVTGAEKVLQQGGQVAGLAGSLANRAISAVTPDIIEKPVAKVLQTVGTEIAKTPIAQKTSELYGKFKEKNPRAAKNVESVANIGALIPQAGAVAETYRLGKGLIKGVAKPVARGLGIKTAQELDPVINLVTPELSDKSTIQAIKKGETQKTGLLGKITIKQEDPTNIADAVRSVVDPNITVTENTTRVINALGREAETLKARVNAANHPYTFKELNSRINKLEKPILITSDSTLNNAYNKVRNAALAIAKKEGGTIADLLEARKKFDNFVDDQFPNLYTSEKLTPMKKAITDIRKEMNKFAGDNLPDGFGFQDSLDLQSTFYDAIDNMAPKALKEVGTNRIQRTTGKIPGIIKDTAKASIVGGALKGLNILQ